MDSKLSQLFWFAVILIVIIFNIIKFIKKQKPDDNQSRELKRRAGQKPITARRKPEKKMEWDSFVTGILGFEQPERPVRRVVKAKPKPAKQAPLPEAERIEAEKEVKPLDYNSHDIGSGRLANKLETSIEGREMESFVESHHLETSIDTFGVEEPDATYAIKRKSKKRYLQNFLREGGLKEAVIFAEIIGPPASKKRRKPQLDMKLRNENAEA